MLTDLQHQDLVVYESPNGYKVMFIYDEHNLCTHGFIASIRNTNSVFLRKGKFQEWSFAKEYCRKPDELEEIEYRNLLPEPEDTKPKKKKSKKK